MLKMTEVTKVDIHRLLFILRHLLRHLRVVFQWHIVASPRISHAVFHVEELLGKLLVVFVIRTELIANKYKNWISKWMCFRWSKTWIVRFLSVTYLTRKL